MNTFISVAEKRFDLIVKKNMLERSKEKIRKLSFRCQAI